jgi:hypothetical protein
MKWIALADPIRVEPWDILSHPGCFLRRKKAAVFIFPFSAAVKTGAGCVGGSPIHQSDFIGQEYAVTRLLAIIRFPLAAPLGSSASIHQ